MGLFEEACGGEVIANGVGESLVSVLGRCILCALTTVTGQRRGRCGRRT